MPTLTRNQKRKIASAPSEKEPASAKATTETEVDAERKNKRPRLSKNHGKKIKDPKDLLPDTEYAGWQIGFTLCMDRFISFTSTFLFFISCF